MADRDALADLTLDHVGIAVEDLAATLDVLVGRYGFDVLGLAGGAAGGTRAATVGKGHVLLVLTESAQDGHPAADYVRRHGDGVCDIALRSADAARAYAEAVRRGARPVAAPAERDGIVTAAVGGFGDVVHTIVERRPGRDERSLPGFDSLPGMPTGDGVGLRETDHLAVCVPAGELARTVAYYESVLGLRTIFTERIVVGAQAMDSVVVQSGTGTVTLTIIEPDTSRARGQIDEFVESHGGAGVQHVAFATDDIDGTVGTLRERGVDFLSTPGAYYDTVGKRMELTRHPVERLRELDVLVDSDHHGQLYQVFTRSTHPRRTLFFEVIERAGARTFGSGNIKALYEAVELQRSREASPR